MLLFPSRWERKTRCPLDTHPESDILIGCNSVESPCQWSPPSVATSTIRPLNGRRSRTALAFSSTVDFSKNARYGSSTAADCSLLISLRRVQVFLARRGIYVYTCSEYVAVVDGLLAVLAGLELEQLNFLPTSVFEMQEFWIEDNSPELVNFFTGIKVTTVFNRIARSSPNHASKIVRILELTKHALAISADNYNTFNESIFTVWSRDETIKFHWSYSALIMSDRECDELLQHYYAPQPSSEGVCERRCGVPAALTAPLVRSFLSFSFASYARRRRPQRVRRAQQCHRRRRPDPPVRPARSRRRGHR